MSAASVVSNLPAASLTSFTAWLYYLCFLFLIGMAAFVWSRNTRAWVNRCFALTALSLLTWSATLFIFQRTTSPAILLWLGRANFAAMVPVVLLAWLLVRAVAGIPVAPLTYRRLTTETLVLTFFAAFTPLVDRAEFVRAGVPLQHVTVYGVLFPLYVVHVVAYLGAALLTAFRSQSTVAERGDKATRDRLLLLGSGMLATGSIALVANVVLPYGLGDFHWVDAGPLSIILFLLAVAYAVVRHRLFDIRVLVRGTLVYGMLLSLVLAAYSSVVFLVTERLTQGTADALTRFGVLVIAFSFDPVRRFFEHRVDILIFNDNEHRRKSTSEPR